jgi:hypothetical protein
VQLNFLSRYHQLRIGSMSFLSPSPIVLITAFHFSSVTIIEALVERLALLD